MFPKMMQMSACHQVSPEATRDEPVWYPEMFMFDRIHNSMNARTPQVRRAGSTGFRSWLFHRSATTSSWCGTSSRLSTRCLRDMLPSGRAMGYKWGAARDGGR